MLEKINPMEARNEIQSQAIRTFFEGDGKGTVVLPTGSGKTRIGLRIMEEIARRQGLKKMKVLILYPATIIKYAAWIRELQITTRAESGRPG